MTTDRKKTKLRGGPALICIRDGYLVPEGREVVLNEKGKRYMRVEGAWHFECQGFRFLALKNATPERAGWCISEASTGLGCDLVEALEGWRKAADIKKTLAGAVEYFVLLMEEPKYQKMLRRAVDLAHDDLAPILEP
jgi:hypothetical protein